MDVPVLFLEDAEGDICSFRAVRKVHKINRHKWKEQINAAYQNAGWMSPELVTIIDRMVNDCRVCQKFEWSIARPRVTLPKSTTFNEIVILNLKEFGSRYILWMVDSFMRFIQGKLIPNKKADTIIAALTDSWCMNVGFPKKGFFVDNGSKFANVKLNKLTSKLGLTVKFGLAYSPWSNGINERNLASADIMIKKLTP